MPGYDQCSYTHDTSDEDRTVEVFEHVNADVWACQHPAAEASEYCPFHQPVENKDDRAVVQRFREVVNSGYEDADVPPQERLRFVGAKFGDFSLPLFSSLATSGEFAPAAAEYPIDLRAARIEGALHWSKTTIRHDVLLDGVSVEGTVDFSETTIEGEFSFVDGRVASLARFDRVEIAAGLRLDHSEFELAVSLDECEIDGDVSFEAGHVHAPSEPDARLDDERALPGDLLCIGGVIDDLVVDGAVVEGRVGLQETTIEGDARFEDVTIEDEVSLVDTTIEGDADFSGAGFEVNHRVDFTDAAIEGDAWFRGATIEGDAWFRGATIGHSLDFEDATVEGGARFEDATVERDVTFRDAVIERDADFVDAIIERDARFQEVTIRGDQGVEFSDATIESDLEFRGAVIPGDANFWSVSVAGDTNFRDATIGGDATFRDATIEGNVTFGAGTIERDARFEGVTIQGTVGFDDALVESDASFEDATIEGTASFEDVTIEGNATFTGAVITDDHWVDFSQATVHGDADFENVTIGGDANFGAVTIESETTFENSTTGGDVNFKDAKIGGATRFRAATIESDAQFENSTIGGSAGFQNATIEGDAGFVGATIDSVLMDGTQVRGDLDLSAELDRTPSLIGITVGHTLRLAFSLPGATNSVIDLHEAAVGSIQVAGDARSQVLKLDGSSIGALEQSDVPDIDTFASWYLERIEFDIFDFTASRDVLTALDWNLHQLEPDAREALAHDAAADDAEDDTEMLVNILAGLPTVSRSIDSGELDPSDLDALLALAARTALSDEALVSKLVAGDTDRREVVDDPAIGWYDEGTYTQTTAEAIHHLSDTLANEGPLVNAVATEAVSAHLADIASVVADTDIEVGTEAELPPSVQVGRDRLPIDALQTAITEEYADPDDFRPANNPEAWVETYQDAKTTASDQGLNTVAAEFFLREKRFKRRRHAQGVREEGSLQQRTEAVFDWVSNLTMDLTTGYGERPRNVILSSGIVIGSFTGVYQLLDALPNGGGLSGYLLFSLQNFVTFIIGTRPEGTLPVRYASAIEAFLGAFFVALFVFTLTRSLNR